MNVIGGIRCSAASSARLHSRGFASRGNFEGMKREHILDHVRLQRVENVQLITPREREKQIKLITKEWLKEKTKIKSST